MSAEKSKVTPLRGREVDDAETQKHDLTAESSVLGAMMLTREAITTADGYLKAEYFYRAAHQIIFGVILDLFADTKHTGKIDVVCVAAELGRRDLLEKVGGAGYLHTLIGSVPTAANCGHYALIVLEMAQWRALENAGTSARYEGRVGVGDPAEAIDRAALRIADAAAVGSRRVVADDDADGEDEWLEIDAEVLEGVCDESGLTTGLVDLDKGMGRLKPGNLLILAARPAVGKSVLGVQILRYAAVHGGVPGAIFSTEMTRKDIRYRMLAAEAGVNLTRLETHTLTDAETERYIRARPLVAAAPIRIYDSDLSMPAVLARCRRLRSRGHLGIALIDYAQQLSSGKRTENRQVEVAEVSRGLKLMAQELEIPVIAVCQLNRLAEGRSDHKPLPSDLRESGQLEQDSDKIILMYREEMHVETPLNKGVTELNIAKNRNGPTGIVKVQFEGANVRFRNSTYMR